MSAVDLGPTHAAQGWVCVGSDSQSITWHCPGRCQHVTESYTYRYMYLWTRAQHSTTSSMATETVGLLQFWFRYCREYHHGYLIRVHRKTVSRDSLLFSITANTKHLYNICTMLDQRWERWADVVQMLYKCFVFAGISLTSRWHVVLFKASKPSSSRGT